MQIKIPILLLLLAQLAPAEPHWFKGNTRTHSLWSDGDGFPDMIADWYKKEGYDFLVLSDHNILSRGERWMKVSEIEKRRKGKGEPTLPGYLERFGDKWVELRGEGNDQEVRLKNLPEMRAKFEKEGKFLMIEGEEISDDSHSYHGGDAKPGPGWIRVRAEKLDADSLLNAIKAGDFYPSTGVSFDSIHFDPETNILEIKIAGSDEKDGRVSTQIFGTLRGEENDPAMVGKELATYNTRTMRHQLTGKEWYVRATITSENDHPRGSFPGQKQQAWTQPVRPSAK